jgi:flagellar basal body-associated protein FliL
MGVKHSSSSAVISDLRVTIVMIVMIVVVVVVAVVAMVAMVAMMISKGALAKDAPELAI